MAQDKLRMIPLGGLGEFGMNCMALRWQDEIIVIDAGLMFPEEELLGVDIVVPDISYLVENRSKVKAIVLTHGHEDHIGGLPWILSELNVPVYGTEFTLAYVEGKLEEHRLLDDADLIEMIPGSRFTLGPVLDSAHPRDALAGGLRGAGDHHARRRHPAHRRLQDRPLAAGQQAVRPARLRRTRQARRVLALLQDSTNVDRPGYTPSERAVRPRLDEIFSRTKKKLFFSCFSSSIHRIRSRDGAGCGAWPQGRHHRPLDRQLDRDRAGSGLS